MAQTVFDQLKVALEQVEIGAGRVAKKMEAMREAGARDAGAIHGRMEHAATQTALLKWLAISAAENEINGATKARDAPMIGER